MIRWAPTTHTHTHAHTHTLTHSHTTQHNPHISTSARTYTPANARKHTHTHQLAVRCIYGPTQRLGRRAYAHGSQWGLVRPCLVCVCLFVRVVCACVGMCVPCACVRVCDFCDCVIDCVCALCVRVCSWYVRVPVCPCLFVFAWFDVCLCCLDVCCAICVSCLSAVRVQLHLICRVRWFLSCVLLSVSSYHRSRTVHRTHTLHSIQCTLPSTVRFFVSLYGQRTPYPHGMPYADAVCTPQYAVHSAQYCMQERGDSLVAAPRLALSLPLLFRTFFFVILERRALCPFTSFLCDYAQAAALPHLVPP